MVFCDKSIRRYGTFYSIITVILFYNITLAGSCMLSNQEIGRCSSKTMLSEDSFCYDYIEDVVCLPEDRPTWGSYNQSYRDQLIEEIFMTNLEQVLVNQYNDPWSSNIVSNNLDCYYSYRKFICAWNFPQCDSLNRTLAPCKSFCVSFFSNCDGNTQICEVVYQNKDMGLDSGC